MAYKLLWKDDGKSPYWAKGHRFATPSAARATVKAYFGQKVKGKRTHSPKAVAGILSRLKVVKVAPIRRSKPLARSSYADMFNLW